MGEIAIFSRSGGIGDIYGAVKLEDIRLTVDEDANSTGWRHRLNSSKVSSSGRRLALPIKFRKSVVCRALSGIVVLFLFCSGGGGCLERRRLGEVAPCDAHRHREIGAMASAAGEPRFAPEGMYAGAFCVRISGLADVPAILMSSRRPRLAQGGSCVRAPASRMYALVARIGVKNDDDIMGIGKYALWRAHRRVLHPRGPFEHRAIDGAAGAAMTWRVLAAAEHRTRSSRRRAPVCALAAFDSGGGNRLLCASAASIRRLRASAWPKGSGRRGVAAA